MIKTFEEFCKAETSIEAQFKDTEGKVKTQGDVGLLFVLACEIVKQLAIIEGKREPGLEEVYVKTLCMVVMDELEEEGA